MEKIISRSPIDNSILNHYDQHSDAEVMNKIQNAQNAFENLRHCSYKEKAKWLIRTADLLENQKEELAHTMTREMGKIHSEAESEVLKCAWVCRYYAEHASTFLKEEVIETDASLSYVCFRPLGVILAVMPWNFPLWQVFRFLAPALMAGNTSLLKHSSLVPECAEKIEKLIRESGWPEGSLQNLRISSDRVEKVIAHEWVKAVTLTGSEKAGKSVASIAGSYLKKCVLELGGSDPYIILDDADIDEAVKICVQGRLLNCGQSCIGAKRFIILENVYDEFMVKFKSAMESHSFDDPSQKDTKLGPMASVDLRDEIHEQVEQCRQEGAIIALGGFIPEVKGAFYPPTIVTDLDPESNIAKEEFFGPVALVFRVNSEKEAILLANNTSFGLGACIFSKSAGKAEHMARNAIQAGACFVNQNVKSDPRLPFGGIKNSGFGRELSHYGIKEFTNIKTIFIK